MPKQIRNEKDNEEGPSNGHKPLKKARYVWEVKGKHHLKEAYKKNNNNEVDFALQLEENNNPVVVDNNNETACEELSEKTKEDAKNSKCCNNLCCIQKFLDEADDIMASEFEEISNEIPLTLVTPNPKNEEYYLRKWQARQIARGFVDNTINSVLETWSIRPTDAADMIENYANDGRVEDDAILMAIQSHGLQSSSRLNQPSSSQSETEVAPESRLENIENERKEQENEINGAEETMDFLSAAVSVAIQKKGLSYGY